ncbi:MAG: hypothetical protein R3335_06415 [Anaerolineales bacterium]|nr:hypothetical protein [Anaerolineales bacterium]
MESTKTIRAGAYFGAAGAALLVLMAIIGLGAGETLGVLAQPDLHPPYGPAIKPGAAALLKLMALDSLFLIAYSGAFVGAAAAVWRRAMIWGAVGLGFALLTALLDMSENALTVQIARKALADLEISSGMLTAVSALGFVKYGSASIATASFAAGLVISMPAPHRLTQVTAILLLLFGLVNAITVAFPAAAALLILWMLVVLVAATIFLWRVSRDGVG